MEKKILGLLIFGVLSGLTLWASGRAIMDLKPGIPPSPTPTPEDPQVVRGRGLYAQLKCEYCHRLNGQGGTVGPVLDGIGARRLPQWLSDHLRNPKRFSLGSKMARIPLADQDIRDLTAYLNSLGGRRYTPEAPVLFKRYCAACHSLQAGGSDAPLDLGAEGRYRDLDFITGYIQAPRKWDSQAVMPGFQGKLTEAQVRDLAVYISRGGE